MKKKQNKLEEDVLKYVGDLWLKKKGMSHLLVFWYIREKFSWFKGRPTVNNYFMHMKNWFYYSFTKRYKLSYTRIAGASRKLPSD